MDGNRRLVLESTVISVGEGPYYYPACARCYSKLSLEAGSFCPKCRKVYVESDVYQRYRLCLTISDGLSLLNVTAFGNILTPFFGCSATEFHSKWRRQIKQEVEPLLLKCCLEKTMIGSSFLFGFKGAVKKPIGDRVTLKDIDSLGHYSVPYPGWKRDVVAVQMLPQNDTCHPISVIQHLQKFDSVLRIRKQLISGMNLDHEFILDVLSHNVFSKDSQKQVDKEPLSLEDCKYNFHAQNDNSSFLLSSVEEASIDFSFTHSTQNSCTIAIDSNFSKYHSPETKANDSLGLKPKKRSKTLVNALNDSSPLSSRKSSWCVRNWLRKHNYCGFNETKLGDSFSFVCKATGSHNNFSDSVNLYTSPELPRDEGNNILSSKLPSNFSLDDIISSPIRCEKTLYEACENVSKLLDSHCSNECVKRKIGQKFLSLKTYGKEMEDFESDNDLLFNSDCEPGCNSNKSVEKHSIVNKSQLSFLDMPESEELDLFLGVINAEKMDSERTQLSLRPDISEISRKRKESIIKRRAVENFDRNVTTFYEDFSDMPESEDFNIFLAGINLEQLHLDDKPSELSANKIRNKSSERITSSRTSLSCETFSVTPRDNCRKSRSDTCVETRMCDINNNDSDIFYPSNGSQSLFSDIQGTNLDDKVVVTEGYTVSSVLNNLNVIEMKTNENECNNILTLTQTDDDNSDQFNDSCDLFNSPTKSQGFPCNVKSMTKKVTSTSTEITADRTKQNFSYSLFSPSDLSSSPELVVPSPNTKSQHFGNITIRRDVEAETSLYDDSFVDLFSPIFKMPSQAKHSFVRSANSLFGNSCSISPDLFSSQEIEI